MAYSGVIPVVRGDYQQILFFEFFNDGPYALVGGNKPLSVERRIFPVAGKVRFLNIDTDIPFFKIGKRRRPFFKYLFSINAGDALSFVVFNNVRHFADEHRGNSGRFQFGGNLRPGIDAETKMHHLIALAIYAGTGSADPRKKPGAFIRVQNIGKPHATAAENNDP
jgi:hypothetical protein